MSRKDINFPTEIETYPNIIYPCVPNLIYDIVKLNIFNN